MNRVLKDNVYDSFRDDLENKSYDSEPSEDSNEEKTLNVATKETKNRRKRPNKRKEAPTKKGIAGDSKNTTCSNEKACCLIF